MLVLQPCSSPSISAIVLCCKFSVIWLISQNYFSMTKIPKIITQYSHAQQIQAPLFQPNNSSLKSTRTCINTLGNYQAAQIFNISGSQLGIKNKYFQIVQEVRWVCTIRQNIDAVPTVIFFSILKLIVHLAADKYQRSAILISSSIQTVYISQAMRATLFMLALLGALVNSQSSSSAGSILTIYFPQTLQATANNSPLPQNSATPNSNSNCIENSDVGSKQISASSLGSPASTANPTGFLSTNNGKASTNSGSAAQIQTQIGSNLRVQSSVASTSQNNSLTNISSSTPSGASLYAGSAGSYFTQLPSFQTIQTLITNADQVALVKLIQEVATDSTLNCDRKISYLLEVVGLVRTTIQEKEGQAGQIQVVIDAANTQIARLTKEIERIKADMNQIQIDAFNKAIKADIGLLTQYYDIYNKEQAKLKELTPKINEQRQGIAALKTAIEKEKQNIIEKEQSINQLDLQIQLLDQQISAKRAKKDEELLSLLKSNKTIEINIAIIGRTEKSIEVLQGQAIEISRKIADFNSKITDLEVQVERKRSDGAVATQKYLSLAKDIQKLQDNISEEKKKTRIDNLKFIQAMTATLREQEKIFQNQIDQYYYKCYANSEIKAENSTTNASVAFVGNNFAVEKYIKNSYNSNISIDPKNATVKFYRIDIFGISWKNRYATPFPYIDNNLDSKEFSCMDGAESAEKGKGLIRAIFSDYIQIVNFDNRSLRFKLGTCTRLESTTDAPKAGQTLYWSGSPGKNYDEYHLFFGTIL